MFASSAVHGSSGHEQSVPTLSGFHWTDHLKYCGRFIHFEEHVSCGLRCSVTLVLRSNYSTNDENEDIGHPWLFVV
jgi:hypothetical protein